MDNNTGKGNSLKRKLETNEGVATSGNSKRLFVRSAGLSSSGKITGASETNNNGTHNAEFSKFASSVKSRLGKFTGNKLQSHLEGVDSNLQKKWFSNDSPNDTNIQISEQTNLVQIRVKKFTANGRLQSFRHAIANNYTQKKQSTRDFLNETTNGVPHQSYPRCVSTATHSVDIVSVRKKFSAKDRLQSLRNKISNKDARREWFSSDIPQLSNGSQFIVQSRLTDPVLHKQQNELASYKVNVFQPFEPITKSSPKCPDLLSEKEVLTDYDDSESAAEFGKDNSESSEHRKLGNKNCQLAYVQSLVHRHNNNSSSESTETLILKNNLKTYRLNSKNTSDNDTDRSSCSSYGRSSDSSELLEELSAIEKQPQVNNNIKVCSLTGEKTDSVKLNSNRTTMKTPIVYSANDRIRKIRAPTTILNDNLPDHLMKYAGKPLQSTEPKLSNFTVLIDNNMQEPLIKYSRTQMQNIKSSNVTNPTHTTTSTPDILNFSQSNNVISNIVQLNNPNNESQINQPLLLNGCSLNTENCTLRNSSTNLEYPFLSADDGSQANAFPSITFGNSSYLLSNENPVAPELQFTWMENSESYKHCAKLLLRLKK